jgi:glycosyltransferase involved in cell wall biosynthesis
MLTVRAFTKAEHIGYGRMAAQLWHAIEGLGYEVSGPDDEPAQDVLFATIPPLCKRWLTGQRLHILTMYETTRCPVEFRNLADFDTVFVPCEENRVAFAEWHPNVVRVPLGVDGDAWKWTPRPQAGPFTFLASGHEYRKGLDVAMAAFKKAFPRRRFPHVRLVLKMPKPMEWFKGTGGDERIEVLTGYLSADDEVALYAKAHAYVGLSRGEGFGMMPLQAIAQGCPTIMSACGGHTQFANLASAVVGCDLEPATKYGLFGEAGDWWEPRLDEAIEAMRQVYADYTGHQASAWLASMEARERYTWTRTAHQIVAVIGDGEPYDGPGTMQYRLEALFPIAVERPVVADIGPHHIEFTPGTEYWHTADVKRVLHDAGMLVAGTYDDARMILPERTSP